jgi:hypothetical protein
MRYCHLTGGAEENRAHESGGTVSRPTFEPGTLGIRIRSVSHNTSTPGAPINVASHLNSLDGIFLPLTSLTFEREGIVQLELGRIKSWNSSAVRTWVMDYGLGRGIEVRLQARSKDTKTVMSPECPDWFWGPPNFGGSFRRCRAGGGTSHLHLMTKPITTSPLSPKRRCLIKHRVNFTFTTEFPQPTCTKFTVRSRFLSRHLVAAILFLSRRRRRRSSSSAVSWNEKWRDFTSDP